MESNLLTLTVVLRTQVILHTKSLKASQQSRLTKSLPMSIALTAGEGEQQPKAWLGFLQAFISLVIKKSSFVNDTSIYY
jgi:hypothetical protein